MFSIKASVVAFLAIVPLAFGSPTLKPRQYDPAIWTAVEWNGDFVYYKTGKFHPGPSTKPGNVTERAIRKRDNECGGSSFTDDPNGGPWPWTSDCWGLHDWLAGNSGSYDVESFNFGVVEVLHHGTCTFAAGTENLFLTLIGNEDMADLINDSINRYQFNGQIGALGNMGCWNYFGTASVNWAVGLTGKYNDDGTNGGV